jgi:hypothetical protein
MEDQNKKPGITPTRIALWVLGGSVGLYLIGSGIGRALGWF